MTRVIAGAAARTKVVSGRGRRLNLRFFNVSLFGLLVFLGAYYLISISDLTVKGFALQELKSQAGYLAAENLSQKEEIDGLQSYYALSSQAPQLQMVPVDNIEYVVAAPSVVARK
jgi:hypothetical protein